MKPILPLVPLFVGCTGEVVVDLAAFPESGDAVPSGTVLADQWQSVGILFDARPENVDPVMVDFGGGNPNLFFSPDQRGAIAVFTFVAPGSDDPVDITRFSIRPFFDPGESSMLVGLDASGVEVVTDTIGPSDIGTEESRTLDMAIEGSFRTVEWRTTGNPGIAAKDLAFTP